MPILRVNSLAKDTNNAVGVLDSKDHLIWLPKSQIKIVKTMKDIEITVPSWLAAKADTLEYEED